MRKTIVCIIVTVTIIITLMSTMIVCANDSAITDNNDNLAQLLSEETSYSSGGKSVISGDVNGDENVSTADIVIVRRILAGGYDLVAKAICAADVNNDGAINTTDVILIRRYLAGGYDVELYSSEYNFDSKTGERIESNQQEDDSIIDSGSCGDDLTYTLYDDMSLVISGTGAMYDWDTIIDVPWYASSSGHVEKVVIEQGCTTIGRSAFAGTKGDPSELTSIEIPNSVEGIGSYAFDTCVRLTSVKLPSSLKSIEMGTFNSCYRLTSIEIPNSVESIETSAFSFCHSLSSIEIPNSVESIGSNAFYDCSSLSSIELPVSLKNISGSAFSRCTMLTSIDVDVSNQNYCSLDGVLFNKDKSELVSFPGGLNYAEYVIPKSVTSIGVASFYSCKNLMRITIPSSVSSISECAFYNCSGLTELTINSKVFSVDRAAFNYLTNLKKVNYAGNESQWNNIMSLYPAAEKLKNADEIVLNYEGD